MVFTAIKYIINEHRNNFKSILLLAFAHAKMQTEGTTLGLGWTIIRDFSNFVVLIIFRYLLAGDAKIDGMNLIAYLITGLVPWHFINDVLNLGVNTIKTNKILISGMQFPAVILPTIETFAIFYRKIFNLFVLFGVVAIFGNLAKFNIWLFLYYYLATIILMLCYNLFVSSIVALSRDFSNFYQVIMRTVFFLTPIIWNFKTVEAYPFWTRVLKINPLTYLITGFRDAFEHGLAPKPGYTIYFWLVTIVLFVLGCVFQYKLRKYYADYI